MINPGQLRPAFLSRSRREKILAVLFIVVLALIWASTWLTRVQAFSRDLGAIQSTANNQAQWLDNRANIETSYESALAQLSAADLPTAGEVQAQVDALVRKHELSNNLTIAPPRTQVRDRLTFHTITVSFSKADYLDLEAFQNELRATLPTVNLEEITLVADRREPSQLDTRLQLVAVEFNQ